MQVNFGMVTLLTMKNYKCKMRLISTNQMFDRQVFSVHQLSIKHLVDGT